MSGATLAVVTFLWGREGSVYGPEQVHALQRMVAAHLSIDHRFVCITDDPTGIECDTLRMWPDGEPSASVGYANGVQRLRLFDPIAAEWLGTDWVLWIDLDCLIVDDVTPLVTWDDLRMNRAFGRLYNGSLALHRLGSFPHVWRQLPADRDAYAGDDYKDDAWIERMVPGAPTWGEEHGIYKIAKSRRSSPVPDDARVLFFSGGHKPWGDGAAWIHEDIVERYRRWMEPA